MGCFAASMGQRPQDDIYPKPECFITFFRRIAVNLGICPAIRGVAFIRVVDDETPVVKQTEPLRRLSIV
jgi:hypothetical protein